MSEKGELSKKRLNMLVVGVEAAREEIGRLKRNDESAFVSFTSWDDLSYQNVADCDVVVFNLGVSVEIYTYSSILEHYLEFLKDDLKKQQLQGGIIIVFSSQKKLVVRSRDKRFKYLYDAVSTIWPFIPKSLSKSGYNIRIEEDSPKVLDAFFKTGLKNFHWDWSIEDKELSEVDYQVIARNYQGNIVSILFYNKPGYLFILPLVKDIEKVLNDIIQDIDKIKDDFSKLKPLGEIKVKRPSWMDDWDKLKGKKLVTRKEQILDELEEIDILEKLVYTYGKPLELSVRYVIEILGFKIIAKGNERADLIFECENIRFVAETKGLKKIATEYNISQLFKWVAEEREKKKQGKIPQDQRIKYLFICNSERGVTPGDRHNPFHEKVIKDAQNNGWGLLSTLELFKAIVALKEGRLTKKEINKKIIDQIGEITLEI